jgi:hypothetical protein
MSRQGYGYGPIKAVAMLCALLSSTGALATELTDSAHAGSNGPSGAWFDLPLPGPATDQVIDFTQVDLPMIPAPSVRRAPELLGSKVHGYIDAIVDISYRSRAAGDRTWGRLAGTRWAEMTVDYVIGQLQRAGIQNIKKIEVPFRGPEQIASDWHLKVLALPEFGPGSQDVELQSAFPMAQTAEGAMGQATESELPPVANLAISAPVIYLGAGTLADLAGKDFRGKIAVLRIEPAPALFYSPEFRLAQQLVAGGAASVIIIYDTPGNMQVHFGACKGAPCFTVGGEDGQFLMAVIAKAAAANVFDKLKLSLSQTLQTNASSHAYMMVAKVAGQRSDENLVVSAHSDAWFSGANDNASGIAGLIALAKQFAAGPRPKHDMYFVLSPGHHSPTGATQRFAELYPDVARANIIAINLEHIGQQGVYRSYFNQGRMGPSVSKYGVPMYDLVPVNWDSAGREISGGPMTPVLKQVLADAAVRDQFTAPARFVGAPVAELAPIVAAGATGIQDVETSIWYHTSGDTPATVSAESMQRVLLFYQDVLHQLDRLSRAQIRGSQ